MNSLTSSERLEDLPQACAPALGYNDTSRAYLRRLLAMGLVPGIEFTVVRRAPFGDPVEIEVLGFHLSLRAHEAAALKVREVRGA